MKKPDGIPIAVVERETGLSKDVLRKWEVRYQFPAPARNERGDRVYSREQVNRLRTIKRLLDSGYRPSRLLRMSDNELVELTASSSSSQPPGDHTTAVAGLLELLKQHQSSRFRATLKRLLQAQGLELFVQDTVAPLSRAVGEAWSLGEIRVFEEHLFSDVAAATLRQALEATDVPEGRPRILMTTLPGELHTLGLLMAACLFTLRGAHCIYLGAETPSEDVAKAAEAHKADVVALSFSSAFPTRQIRPALLGLRQQLAEDIDIVVGGVGISRQDPVDGVTMLDGFASVDQYAAHVQPHPR